MAHLTRLFLNLRSRRIRAALANPYEMHRDIMSAFPDAGASAPGRHRYQVLHRLYPALDAKLRTKQMAVLVQSAVMPDWHCLPQDEHGQPWASWHETREYDPRPEWFESTRVLRFCLRANPTKRLCRNSLNVDGTPIDPRWIGKRVEIRVHDQQIAWLARQATSRGFELISVDARPPRDEPVFNVCGHSGGKAVASRKRVGAAAEKITHAAVTFEGVIRVRDPQVFTATLLEGIGPAKAFGFGLLSVAPL